MMQTGRGRKEDGSGGRQVEMSRPGNGCALGPDKSTGNESVI